MLRGLLNQNINAKILNHVQIISKPSINDQGFSEQVSFAKIEQNSECRAQVFSDSFE